MVRPRIVHVHLVPRVLITRQVLWKPTCNASHCIGTWLMHCSLLGGEHVQIEGIHHHNRMARRSVRRARLASSPKAPFRTLRMSLGNSLAGVILLHHRSYTNCSTQGSVVRCQQTSQRAKLPPNARDSCSNCDHCRLARQQVGAAAAKLGACRSVDAVPAQEG